MADILNVGTSALLSLQRAITTTGHNIANVNTEGYSRQRVNFETLIPQLSGGSYIGSGVNAASIERIYDQFLTSEVRSRTTSQNGFQAFSELSSRLDSLLADPDVGLSPTLESFFGALQDVANNPGSLPERQVLLGEAEVLADRFHYLDSNFRSLESELNARIETSVSDINSLARSIAELNEQVVRATAASGGAPPNDLLDSRDQLITQLSEKIGVTTVAQSDGSINVMVGNGQALVVGFSAQQLQAFDNPYDGTQTLVGIAGLSGSVTDLGRFLNGGELGAVLDFREQVLDPARNQLGLVAMGLAATFNEQHQLGVDLDGQPGGDFFRPLSATYTANPNNSGLSSMSVAISDATALTGDDYNLRYDSGQWTLTNLSTKVSQTSAGPFSVDGLTVSVAGAPVNGDTFLIQPTRQGATLFEVVLNRAEDFAGASPLRSQEILTNIGSASIDDLTVNDASALPLASQVTLTFNPDALGAGIPGFDVTGIAGGPLAYDPTSESNGKSFSLGGFEFTLSGDPQVGDELIIENNLNGSGDNRNALALAGLQTTNLLHGGTASYQDAYGGLVAGVAVKTRQAQAGANTEQVLLNQSVSARDSVSGVNLDEEAANLIRYQQAYQAAAQVIAVANEMFQVLLNATRR
ncbi:MAG: flagellar hook-associated protein FlgK [Porticoccaceae bacterium]|nr:MAG: flagellar hook-associated protein FlgK [Porticoccaceae bacterium]